VHALTQLELRFEADRAAVTASSIGLHVDSFQVRPKTMSANFPVVEASGVLLDMASADFFEGRRADGA
jgi:hypothetical protein